LLYIKDGENEPLLLIDDCVESLREDLHTAVCVIQEIERLCHLSVEAMYSGSNNLVDCPEPGNDPLAIFFVMFFGWHPNKVSDVYEYLVNVPFRRLRRLNLKGYPVPPEPRWFDDYPGPGYGFELGDALQELDRLRLWLDNHLANEDSTSDSTIEGHEMLACSDVANRFQVDPEKLRARLKRWMPTHQDDWIEVTNRHPNDPRYLYRVSAVLHIINDLKSTS
jgi:hypothetical protein